MEDARAKRLKLNSLVHYNSAIASLSAALRTDASGFDPDGPLPEDIPETNTSKTVQDGVLKLAREENLTVRQLAQRFRGHSRLAFIRTPETVADEPETWLREDATDGFTIVFPFVPQAIGCRGREACCPRAAASGDCPSRVRRHDSSRASWSAEATESVLLVVITGG